MVLRYPLDYLRAFRLPALGFGVWPGLGCSSLALAWPLGRHLLLAPRGDALREALGAAPREGLMATLARASFTVPGSSSIMSRRSSTVPPPVRPFSTATTASRSQRPRCSSESTDEYAAHKRRSTPSLMAPQTDILAIDRCVRGSTNQRMRCVCGPGCMRRGEGLQKHVETAENRAKTRNFTDLRISGG